MFVLKGCRRCGGDPMRTVRAKLAVCSAVTRPRPRPGPQGFPRSSGGNMPAAPSSFIRARPKAA
jgi:hypothetical protein